MQYFLILAVLTLEMGKLGIEILRYTILKPWPLQ